MFGTMCKGGLGLVIFVLLGILPLELRSQGAVDVQWNANLEPDLMGYKVHWGTVSRNYNNTVDVGNATSYHVENLQTMVKYFFAVTAYDTARNESGYSVEISCVLGDLVSPTVIAAAAISSTEVIVTFSETVETVSAEQKNNYAISNGVSVLNAVLGSDGVSVRLSTTQHVVGQRYTVSVFGVKDIALPPNTIAAGTSFSYNYGGGEQDLTPPTITAADLVSPTHLNIYFSEPLDQASASVRGNYSINNGIQIQSVFVDASGSLVQLTTSSHQHSVIYILQVSNVKDVAGNIIVANSSYSYSYEPEDTVGPTLTLVSAVDANHLDVMFSEEVDRSSAEIASNYSVSDGVTVYSASLDGSGRVVNLITGTHDPNHLYYLTVNGIRDASPQANEIEPNSNYAYMYEPADLVGPTIRTVSVIDATHLEVAFNETVEETSAENTINYRLNNGMSVISAGLLPNGSMVKLETTEHQSGQVYVLSISGVRDNSPAANEIISNSAYTYVYDEGGTDVGPTIVEVTVISGAEIQIEFSKNLDKASSETVSNYFLNNNLIVYSANLLASQKVVSLTTSEHQWGKIYILQVNNVTDTNGNKIVANSSYSYLYEPADVVGPTLTMANIVDATHIDVMFSEQIGKAGAETATNYSISGGISVISAQLASSGRVVQLQTSAHESSRLYLLSVRGIKDTSPQANEMAPNSSYAYIYEPADVINPTIRLARIIDATHVEVVFSETVEKSSAETIGNYIFNNGLTVVKAELTASGNVVSLETTSHENGKVYVLLISGVRDNSQAANEIAPNSSYTYVYGSGSTGVQFGPAMVEVMPISATEVRVEFSKRVSKTTAELISNYRFNHILQVLQARLDDSGLLVYLTTTQHQDGALYSLTVSNIAAADNPYDTIRPNSQYFYIYDAEGGLMPTVTSIVPIAETLIEVHFSAPLDKVTAENRKNYAINNNMTVLSAELDNSERVVYLETSKHVSARAYILSISGVKPVAFTSATGVNITYAYTYLAQLRLDFQSNAEVQISYLEVGKEYYVDRNYVATYVPDYLFREMMIKTCNDDRNESDGRFMVFQLNQPATVYVAYDSRAMSAPNWLSGSFTRTADFIGVSDAAEQLVLWKKDFPATQVVLGGNSAAGTNGSKSMYCVIVKEMQSGGSLNGGNSEGADQNGDGFPHSVDLLQNYPNPFNPFTHISFELPSLKHASVTIYDILGRKVKVLFEGSADIGHHRLFWNATADNGNFVSAGTYFCYLATWDVIDRNGGQFIENYETIVRKMTYLK